MKILDVNSLPFNLSEIVDMNEVYGVIGFGSYFRQTQNFDDYSDIDLLVIRNSKTLCKEAIKYKEYLIDITQCSFHILQKLMTRAVDRLHWQENLSSGIVLSDPKGLVSIFLKEVLLSEHELVDADIYSIREMKGTICNCIRKVTRHKGTVTQFHYISLWMQNCYNIICYANKIAPFKHKPLIDQHIKIIFPELAEAFEQIAATVVGVEKAQIMKIFVTQHIDPLFSHISSFGIIKNLTFKGGER